MIASVDAVYHANYIFVVSSLCSYTMQSKAEHEIKKSDMSGAGTPGSS